MVATSTQALRVRVRDSETGLSSTRHYEVSAPFGSERERSLNAHVPKIFPGAELRTYGQGQGTFVAGLKLIEASYGPVRAGLELQPLPEVASERPVA